MLARTSQFSQPAQMTPPPSAPPMTKPRRVGRSSSAPAFVEAKPIAKTTAMLSFVVRTGGGVFCPKPGTLDRPAARGPGVRSPGQGRFERIEVNMRTSALAVLLSIAAFGCTTKTIVIREPAPTEQGKPKNDQPLVA